MDEICLRKPPVHLEGEHLLKTRKWQGRVGRNWETKFFMVLGNTLSICENSSMTGESLLDVEFDDIDICDGHIKYSSKKYIIRIQLNNGVTFDKTTEIYFSIESKEVFEKWSKGLVYAKHYWLKKSSVPAAIRTSDDLSSSDRFLVDVIMYNGVTAAVQLQPTATFKELVKQVNRTGGCYCKVCEVQVNAKLFVVNTNGEVSCLSKDEKIYNYHIEECKFFLMEKDRRVLVVYFETGREDRTFVSCTAHKGITASEMTKIPVCREEVPKDCMDSLLVYFLNDSEDVQLAGDDKVLDYIYSCHGDLLNKHGKLVIRTQDGIKRSKTISISKDEILKLNSAKQRAQEKLQDDIQRQVNDLRNSENGKFKGEIEIRPVEELSSAFPKSTEKVNEDEFFNLSDESDLETCIPFLKPNAYEELFLQSADSSTSELSVTDSMDNSSAILSSSYKMEDTFPINDQHDTTMEIRNVSDEDDDKTRKIIELYSTTILEPVDPENNQAIGSTSVKIDDVPEAIHINHTENDQPAKLDNQPIKNTPETLSNKIDEIVVSKKVKVPLQRKKVTNCLLCLGLGENVEKPRVIKTNILSFLNKAGDDLYICLGNTHLRKSEDNWYAADTSIILQGFSDPEWIEAMKNRRSREYLGEFVCLFVSARSDWFVRQIQQNQPNVHKEEEEEEEEECFVDVERPADIQPDVVTKECPTKFLDDESSLEGSLEGSFNRNSRSGSLLNTTQMKNTFTEFKHTIQQKAQSIKDAIPPLTIDKNTGNLDQHVDKIKGKLKDAYDVMYDTISQISVDDRLRSNDLNKDILSDEFITIDQSYVKPLKDVIFKICNQLESVELSQQHQYGDDFQTISIGWEIRGDFCTILANLLRIGLTERSTVFKSLFSAPASITLWELVKDFSLAFKRREFVSIVKNIKASRCLLSDDQRFRFFICELLNRSTECGTEKLIVTFFQDFPMITNKLEKYYLEGSFWRMSYESGFGVILDEIILSMKHFNGWPFKLHIDFEYRLCPHEKKKEIDTHLHEDSLVSFE